MSALSARVERLTYHEEAEQAGWLIELEVFDPGEGALATAWSPAGSYTLGPKIRREDVPAGAVYEHERRSGQL